MSTRIHFCFLLVGIHAYGMDTNLSTVLFKGLIFTQKRSYLNHLRHYCSETIALPQTQFEAVAFADTLPIDIQRKLKDKYIGGAALRSHWAKSYAVYKQFPIKGYNGKMQSNLAVSKQGLVAVSNARINIWNPATDKNPRYDFAEIPTGITRKALAFLSEEMIAEEWMGYVNLWDIKTGKHTNQLNIPGHSIDTSYIHPVDNKHFFTISTMSARSLDDLHVMRKTTRYIGGHQGLEASTLLYWHVDGDKGVDILGSWVSSCALAPDGYTLALGCDNGIVELMDMRKYGEPSLRWKTSYGFEIKAVEFLTPTCVVAESRGHLDLLDTTQQNDLCDDQKTVKTRGFGMSDYYVKVIKRINDRMVAVFAQYDDVLKQDQTAIKILDIERGYVHNVPGSFYHTKDTYPLACVHNMIATLSKEGEVLLYRPQLPSVPNNSDNIPFAAYALAANEDTYETNLVDDPDYSEDNV